MAIDLQEHLVSLTGASKIFPGRPSNATIWRWRTKGVKGIKLETIVCGGRVFTSTEAIERFIQATTANAAGHSAPVAPKPVNSKIRQQQLDAADRILAKAGI